MNLTTGQKEVRFHAALMALHTLAKYPDAALESAIAVPEKTVDAMFEAIHKVADFLKEDGSTELADAPAIAANLESWITHLNGGVHGSMKKLDPPAAIRLAPTEERHTPVRWTKMKKGTATMWTAKWEGFALRVERKKTGSGVQFDAFLNDKYSLRSKSSVTARDRIAMEALHKLA